MSLILIGTAFVALTVAAAQAPDPKLVAKGQALVVEHKCAMCHTVAGKGGKLSASLDGVSARRDAAGLKRALEDPLAEFPQAKIKMPKVLWKPGDVDAVVAFLQSLKASPAK